MDNRRLLLLIIFSFSLVMLWDAWQKYSQPKGALPATVAGAEAPAPQPSANLHTPLPAAPVTGAVSAARETALLGVLRLEPSTLERFREDVVAAPPVH